MNMPGALRSRPRVLHVVPSLFGERGIVGGAERYAFECARHMARHTATGLVTFGRRAEVLRVAGLTVRVLRGHPVRRQPQNPFALSLLGELGRYDVVHCHQQHVVASSAAAAFCRLSGRRVFVSDHGGGGWDVSAYVSTDGWFHGHLHVSKYSRELAGHQEKPWAHVVYCGVDTERFSPSAAVPREGTALFVGRLLPHKGVNYLIEAVPPDMRLEVVGRPYDERYLTDLKRLAEEKPVRFRADCDDAGLVAAYRKALCLVLPSVYRDLYGNETRVPELLGQTLVEAMACGTPVICTEVAGMPEVVQDGVTGFIVPPNDPEALREKLCWLRDHPDAARAMGEAGWRRVLECFTWDAVVRRCLAIYQAAG
jgi:glycosyltransferase involved in cell wall biosynthesis